jgi:rhamnose utilization protein RhaD (predicted bifunctional aldolase and dehydrogenase)
LTGNAHPELASLVELSVRLGRNPLLVQAATGNTSIKIDGTLWIKASGKWLARTGEGENFVPLNLAEIRRCVQQGDLCPEYLKSRNGLAASIETAMHATLPHRVVIHVHSVNTIAWAVRRDAGVHLSERLAGLAWKWIPYVASGLPLAYAIGRTLPCRPDVFILANHGLVVGADSCEEASNLLDEVEKRLAIEPRPAPPADTEQLIPFAAFNGWRLPVAGEPHALGTDCISRQIVARGTLYPCHAIFIGPSAAVVHDGHSIHDTIDEYFDRYSRNPSLLIIQGAGVLVSSCLTPASVQVLIGLSHVVRRLNAETPIRYLRNEEMTELLNPAVMNYRQLVESTECRS